MNKIFPMALFCAAAFALAGCDKDDNEQEIPIDPIEPTMEMTPYAAPQMPEEIGGELPSYPYYQGIDEAIEYISDNSKDLANLAIQAGAGAAGKALSAYLGVKGLEKPFAAVAAKLFPAKEQRSEELLLLDTIHQAIDKISDDLDALTTMVGDIYKKLDETQLNILWINQQDIDEKVKQIFIVTDDAYFDMENCKTDEEKENVVREWAKQTAAGGMVYATTVSMLGKVLGAYYNYNGVNQNYLGCFDLYAYSQFPWESQGYPAREAYRAQLAVGFARALNMCVAYYTLKKDKTTLNNIINKLYPSMAKFFDMSRVVRREDKAVCQIAGAHFEIPIKPTVYNAQTVGYMGEGWLSDYLYTGNKFLRLACENRIIGISSILKNLGDKSWESMKAVEDAALRKVESVDCNAFVAGQFTKAEIQAVLSHSGYNNDVTKAKSNFLQCLMAGGVQGLEQYASRPIGIAGETNDFTCIATNEMKYEVYLEGKPHENYYESESRITGYVYASMPLNEFKQHTDNVWEAPYCHQYPQDTHKSGKTEYYDTFFLLNGNTMSFPGHSCLFFEPTEIKRMKEQYSPINN